MGTVVRVPLHGRRVRGWVLESGVSPEVERSRVRPIFKVSSAGPPPAVVALTAFGAWRWAGPRAPFLRAASPPNAVAPGPRPEGHVAVFPERAGPIAVPEAPVRVITWPPASSRIDLVRSLLEPAGSTVVVAPDPGEGRVLAEMAQAEGREVHVMRGDQSAAERTSAWARARHGACVVVGGRIAVFAPVPDLAAIVVLDDVDEALAEERAPVWHARELAIERARVEGARVTFVSPCPSVEAVTLAGGALVSAPAAVMRGGWPHTDVVDLRDEPPGAGLLSRALGPAIQRALDSGGRALLVVNRKGRAHLLVCRSCGSIAECERCGSRLSEGDGTAACEACGHRSPLQCVHCGSIRFSRLRHGVTGLRDAIAALAPRRHVLAVDSSSAPLPAFDIAVGTEAVLHRVPTEPARPVTLVAFPEIDQELLAPRYRAAEQALWLLVRAARLVGDRAGGGRILLQTRVPEHEVLRAVGDGDPSIVEQADAERRRALGYPPFGGVAALSGDSAAVDAACDLLSDRLTVLGPNHGRALLRADTVEALCDALAAADLGPARALGRLRIDVDPLRI